MKRSFSVSFLACEGTAGEVVAVSATDNAPWAIGLRGKATDVSDKRLFYHAPQRARFLHGFWGGRHLRLRLRALSKMEFVGVLYARV